MQFDEILNRHVVGFFGDFETAAYIVGFRSWANLAPSRVCRVLDAPGDSWVVILA
jgi:hypothetical protein